MAFRITGEFRFNTETSWALVLPVYPSVNRRPWWINVDQFFLTGTKGYTRIA